MQPRQTDLEKFSTFLESFYQGSSGLCWRWSVKTPLKKNIELILVQNNLKGDFLALYLLENLKKNYSRIDSQHLSAYLQEAGYWASVQMFRKWGDFTSSLNLQDYFSFANEKILEPEKLLSNYNENRGTKITTYAQKILAGKIADSAYSTINWTLSSDWGLLRKISKKRMKKALEEIGGLANETLEQYLIIWDCFKNIYAPHHPNNSRRLSEPTEEQYKQINNQYNKRMVKSITVRVVKNMLNTCVEVTRKYYNPHTVAYPDNYDLPDDNSNDIDCIEEEEKQRQIQEIKHFLLEKINELSLEEKMLLQLRFGLQLNQNNIAQIFADNYPNFISQQYEVSRQIKRIRKRILLSLFKIKFNQSKVKNEQLEVLKIPSNECISNYCQEIINQELTTLKNGNNSFSLENIQQLIQKFKNNLVKKWSLKNFNYTFLDQEITIIITSWLEGYYR